MTDNVEPLHGKHRGGRRKNSGRKPLPPNQKPTNIHGYVATEVVKAFRESVPLAAERNKLYTQWMRAYMIADGDRDRLLAQSPLAAELLTYLKATDAPEHLRDWLESLIVQQESGDVKVADG